MGEKGPHRADGCELSGNVVTGNFLGYYPKYFPTAEIRNSLYQLPQKETLEMGPKVAISIDAHSGTLQGA